jgi:hypothetical protein
MAEDQISKWIEGATKIKFSGGVVGKVSFVLVAALVVTGVISWKAEIWWIPIAALAVVVIILFVALKLIWFAEKHPHAALLEGAELLTWHQMEMAQKGKGILIDTGRPIESPEAKVLAQEEVKRLDFPDQIEGDQKG